MAVSAVFMDKDGTLVENVPRNLDPARVLLARGAEQAVKLLERRFRILVVSNQPGFSESDLAPVNEKLRDLIGLESFYYCPHQPQAGCECRKPKPGLLLRAASEHGIDLARSWMVGDILDDVEAGRRAGCRTCLVDNGNETEWVLNEARRPDVVVSDLGEAAARILAGRA